MKGCVGKRKRELCTDENQRPSGVICARKDRQCADPAAPSILVGENTPLLPGEAELGEVELVGAIEVVGAARDQEVKTSRPKKAKPEGASAESAPSSRIGRPPRLARSSSTGAGAVVVPGVPAYVEESAASVLPPPRLLTVRGGQYKAMREVQNLYRPSPYYMEQHPQLNAAMRSILFDWMMEVCQEYVLRRETLHYAVNYVDRFLTKVMKAFSSASIICISGLCAPCLACMLISRPFPPSHHPSAGG